MSTPHRKPRKKINRMNLAEIKEALDQLVDSGQVTKNQAGFYSPISTHAQNLLDHAKLLGSDLQVRPPKLEPKKPSPEDTMGRLTRQVQGTQRAAAGPQVQQPRRQQHPTKKVLK